MRTAAQKRLVWRLVGAVAAAFAASMVLTWILHARMTEGEMRHVVDDLFDRIEIDIRERVDSRMLRLAAMVRDEIYEMRGQEWWSDPDESSRRLRALADELGVDEICVADDKGLLTHSARREEVGAPRPKGRRASSPRFSTTSSNSRSRCSRTPSAARGSSTSACGSRTAASCRWAVATGPSASSRAPPSRGSPTAGT